MSTQGLTPFPASGSGQSQPPIPAQPPTRAEIERKLSFKSAASPRLQESPKKKKPAQNPNTGTDSDSSAHPGSPVLSSPSHIPLTATTSHLSTLSVTSSQQHQPQSYAGGSLLSAITTGPGGLAGVSEELDEDEAAGGDEDGEGSASDDAGLAAARSEEMQGMEGERVLKSGYLYKKQERRKVWKKKWFVLRTGRLAYYKDDKEYSLSRVLDLKSIHTCAPVKIKKHSFTFGIVTTKRTFLVEASSQTEMDGWVEAVNQARRRASGEKLNPAPSMSIAIPPRNAGGEGEYASAGPQTHQGTYQSTISNMSGLSGYAPGPSQASPTTATGGSSYFQPRSASVSGSMSGYGQNGPPSPVINTLSSQLARLNYSSGAPSPVISSSPASVGHLQAQGLSVSTPGSRVVSQTRREPSASSMSSSAAAGDYFPQGAHGQSLAAPQGGQFISSDEDEPYFSDPNAAFAHQQPVAIPQPAPNAQMPQPQRQPSLSVSPITQLGPGIVDPSRVILSAYLMKRSKGRGRKVWRKRWFYLTSQGLTYTKSHMDSRALRFIPLSSVLDAIDLDAAGDITDPSDSDSDSQPFRQSSRASERIAPQRQLSSRGGGTGGGGGAGQRKRTLGQYDRDRDQFGASGSGANTEEHTFRLVTAKRTYVLCAPSEEEEIKWLAAFKALLNRERALAAGVSGGMSPTTETAPRLMPYPQAQVPTITQQPPTPAASIGSGASIAVSPKTPSAGLPSSTHQPMSFGETASRQGNQQQQQQQQPYMPTVTAPLGPPITSPTEGHPGYMGGRNRSATYTAKSAVAEVTRRFHPERSEVVQ